MRSLILSLTILCSSLLFGQDFEGVITYKVEMPEMMLKSVPNDLKDSVQMTRKIIKGNHMCTESFTAMGKQVMLEKIGSDTSYLMMNLMGRDIAIEIVGTSKPEKEKDSLKTEGKTDKMFGYKCEKASYTKNGKKYEIIYTKQIDKKYGNSFTMLGGLALQFPIVLTEFETIIYKCSSIEKKPVSDDHFKIPSNFEVISMEEFGKMIGG